MKASLAMMEIIAGVLTYFVTPQFLLNTLHRITQVSFIESRGDIIANYLLHAAQHLSISSLHFAASYLFIHGAIKLWIIIGLWRKNSVITLLLWRFLVCLLFINSIAIPLLILCF